MTYGLLYSVVPIILNGNDTHHPMEDWSMMGGSWWLWAVIVITVVLLGGLLIFLLMGEEDGRRIDADSNKSPERLLDERYAKGQITTKEYKEIKK